MRRLLILLVLMLTPSICFAQASVRTLAGVNAQTGTSYTVTAVDQTKLLTFNNVNPVAVTLPSPANTNFGVGAIFSVRNLGTGRVTITPTSSTIDNAATLVLDPGQGADIYSDGTNYETQKGSGIGLFGSTNPSGTCVNGSNYTNTTTGILWICQNGTWVISSGGGGGGSPSVGANGTVQLSNGSGLFTSSGNVFDLNSLFTVNEDFQGKGPNPYVDIRAYGARPCDIRNTPCAVGDTATISLGSPTQATINTISDFVKGDGFVIYGAGPASMSTAPTGLTAAQNVSYAGMETGFTTGSALGSSTRCYKVAARNFNGAQSPASAETCISNALTAEGPTINTISTISRSGQTVTIVTTAAHPFLVGCSGALSCGEVFVNSGVSDGSMRGWYAVLSAPNSTTITYQTQDSTAFGASSSASGGQITSYPCVHLSWASVANTWEYDIYEGASGAETLIDVSQPQGTNTNLTYDDYGSTVLAGVTSQLPLYISSTPPASAVPENLFGTITNIAGSVITMSVSASTAVTTATIRLDAGQAMKAAATAISGIGANNHAGSLYIPSLNNGTFFQYEVNAPLDLHALQFSIDQAGPLYLNEPIQLGTAGAAGFSWYGNRNPQWGGSFTSASGSNHSNVTIERAQPGIYINSGNGVHFEGLTFQGNSACTNGIRSVLMESGFRSFWRNDTFSGCSTSTDAVSIPLTFRGINSLTVTDFILDEVSFAPGQGGGGGDGANHTPVFWCHFCGNSTWGELYFINRGVQYDLGNNGQANVNVTGPIHINGGQMPLFTTTSVIGNGPSGFQISLGSGQTQTVLMDTIAHPCVAGLGLFAPVVTGPCFPSGAPDISGQPTYRMNGNFNTKSPNTDYWNAGIVDGGAPDSLRLFNYHIATGSNIFVNQVAPPAPTCTVNTGGSLAVGAYTFIIEPAWQDGLQGNSSAASSTCTTSTGNQSITINWTITSGFPLGTNLYYSFNGGGYGSSNTWPALPLPTSQTSLVWTSPPASSPNHLGFDPRSGPTLMNASEVATPQIDLAGDIILTAGAGTPYSLDLPGNQPTTGNTFLSCTAANPAVCSWVPGATGVPWSQIGNPTSNLALSMGTDTSTFNFTSGLLNAFQWYNSTAATVTISQSSPQLSLCGNSWIGSSNKDCWTLQHIPGNGVNAAITDSYGHTGSSTGVVTSAFPGPVAAGPGGGVSGAIVLPQGTTNSTSTGAITIQGAGAITPYTVSLPGAAPTAGSTILSCSAATSSICSWVSNGSSVPNLDAWYFSPNCGLTSNCTTIHDDALFLTDCSTTNASSTVTCPDAVFTANDVGKTVWVTTQGSASITYNALMVCPTTTIATFNSSTSITLTAANDCTSTVTGTAVVFYGTRDGTTIKNAMNAQCANFVMPSGSNSSVPGVAKILIDQPFGNTNATPCNAPFISITGSAPSASSVVFIITPDFNWAGCTGNNGKSSNICFGANAINMSYLSFYGGGLNGTGACPVGAQNKIVAGPWSTVNQSMFLNLNGICPGTAGMIGIEFDSLDSTVQYGGAVQVGQFSCVVNSPSVSGFANDCTNDGASVTGNGCASGIGVCTGLLIKGGAIYQSYGDQWIENAQNQGTLISHGSYYYSTAGNYALTNANGSGGARHLSDNDFFNAGGQPGGLTTTSGGINNDFGSQVYVRNSQIVAGSSGTVINLANDGTAVSFYDECGNTYTGGTIFNNIGNLGQVNNEYCSGNATIATTGKLVLSAGWGSTAAVSALTGFNAPLKFTITNSGTGQGASPTITYTFPTPYLVSPYTCTATQIGGTNATGTFTSSSLSNTGVTFTFSITPTASSTEIVQVTCVTP